MLAETNTRRWITSMSPVVNYDYELQDSTELRLYEKAKSKQWNAKEFIANPETLPDRNPLSLPIESFPLANTSWFEGLSDTVQQEVITDYQGWIVSQFLHGEQFGILTSARISLEASDLKTKLFASIQCVDEGRHLEAYTDLCRRIGIFHPLTESFGEFLDEVIDVSDLDMVHLGLQVLGEGIGLAAFSQIRRGSSSDYITNLYASIMEDEARHVAYGRSHLTQIYSELSKPEMAIREEFVAHSCSLLGDRFQALEVWEKYGLDRKDAEELLSSSTAFRLYKASLFKNIAPVLRDLNLLTPTVSASLRGARK